VTDAYGRLFERASLVTANSEGTLALAHRFGRSDAVLVPNGVDLDRFDSRGIEATESRHCVIGYGGKIGERIDVELVNEVARVMPDVEFEFAGPVLERHIGKALRAIPNVKLLGDVHYEDYPRLVRSWGVTWVPHRVGAGEVGGDAIKIYEYLAAGRPVASTRIIGHTRFDSRVALIERTTAAATLRGLLLNRREHNPALHLGDPSTFWRTKASDIASRIGLPFRSPSPTVPSRD
jgi:glycosyltransferase involved in cell wall biosynthesis